jgi:hypothetical protein
MPEAMAVQLAAEAWGISPVEVDDLPHWCLDEFRAIRSARMRYLNTRVAEALKPGEGSDEFKIAERNYAELAAILDDPTTQDWTKEDVGEKAKAAKEAMDKLAPTPSLEAATVHLLHLLVESRVT